MVNFGEYGGRVLRPFKGFGVAFIAGATLSPETVKNWPLANRRALHETGNIEWYGPPSEAETEVREAGKESKEQKVEKAEVKKAETANIKPATVKPAASRRRTR